MNLRESLYFSSKRTACYDTGPISYKKRGYRLQVQIAQEEYTPVIVFAPGPYLRDIYTVTVALKDGETICEPHQAHAFYDIDDCEAHLQQWDINTEDGWWALEDEDETNKSEGE